MDIHHPTSLQEAEYFFSLAIAGDDYELAEEILNQMPDLKLIEEETQLGQLVDEYMVDKEILSDQVDSNCTNYEQKIQENLNQIHREYAKKFRAIKKKQEKELRDIYQQWKTKRDEIEANSLVQYNDSLATARLLASQTCFKEAKAIRDAAFHKKTEMVINANRALNDRYNVIIQKMMKRHQVELKLLIKKKGFKVNQVSLEMDNAKKTAVECYEVDNADNVVNAVKVATKMVPLALIYQTKDDKPINTGSSMFMNSDATFKNKMKTYKQFAATDAKPGFNKTPTQKNKKSKTFRTLNSKRIATP